MSSLWTPGGEHQVPREGAQQAPTAGRTAQGPPAGAPAGDDWREKLASGELDPEDLTPEQRAEVEEVIQQMAEAQAQMVNTPIEQVIAQHFVGLREIAILHLQQESPDFSAAQAAIDAAGGMLDGLRGRLGELEDPLTASRHQLQMAFVERKRQFESAD